MADPKNDEFLDDIEAAEAEAYADEAEEIDTEAAEIDALRAERRVRGTPGPEDR